MADIRCQLCGRKVTSRVWSLLIPAMQAAPYGRYGYYCARRIVDGYAVHGIAGKVVRRAPAAPS